MPDEPEVPALLALMLLDDARRGLGSPKRAVLLADQDRDAVGRDEDRPRAEQLGTAVALRSRGLYVIQAAIASLHTDEPRDVQIAALYGELVELTGSAVVELNRAIAVAETDGAEAAHHPGAARARRLPVLPLDAEPTSFVAWAEREAASNTSAHSSSRGQSPSAASCSGASPGASSA